MIRILVAEDSVTQRELITALLRDDPEVSLVGFAADGYEALTMTRDLRPDVVMMDLLMPRMDGFEATRRIMVEAPTPIVIVTASVDVREVEVSMHALRAGALTVLRKPKGPGSPDFEEEARQFVNTVKAMAAVKVVRRWNRPSAEVPAPSPAAASGLRRRVIAVGASTGGPAALARLLSQISADFPVPILVVRRMAQGFIDGFAAWLNATSALKVKIAEDGEPLCPRLVYLAPDDRHLGVSPQGTALRVARSDPIDGFRPSATALFKSVASAFGRTAIGIILTGMGQDGVDGLRVLRESGGLVIGQDEASSVVFGMPAAAAAAGVLDWTLSLDEMAPRLSDLVLGGAARGEGR